MRPAVAIYFCCSLLQAVNDDGDVQRKAHAYYVEKHSISFDAAAGQRLIAHTKYKHAVQMATAARNYRAVDDVASEAHHKALAINTFRDAVTLKRARVDF